MKACPTTKLLSEQEAVPSLNIRIQRNTIPDYATDDFWEALSMWMDWKAMKLPPNAGGSLDQPMLWWMIVGMFESEGGN